MGFKDRDPVGDFYVYLVRGPYRDAVDDQLTSSTKLLTRTGKPTVMHFYDGGWGGCRPCAAQMRKWASDPSFSGVQFLCVCVESKNVALYFHHAYGFGINDSGNDSGTEACVVNGYIPSRSYMPVGYGQLGCSGFIISDADGKFITRKSAAYLQFGEDAFDHVESLIRDELGKAAPAPPPFAVAMERGLSDQPKKRKTTDSAPSSSSSSKNLVAKHVSSVGVDSMDEEHKICTDSFNRALKDPTVETLQEVHDVLLSHFAHEEELLDRYTRGDKTSAFSAFRSHEKDHKKMLAIATAEIDKVAEAHAAAINNNNPTTCALVQGGREWRKPPALVANKQSKPATPPPETPVDKKVLEALVKAFHDHAETFDVLYHDVVPVGAE